MPPLNSVTFHDLTLTVDSFYLLSLLLLYSLLHLLKSQLPGSAFFSLKLNIFGFLLASFGICQFLKYLLLSILLVVDSLLPLLFP